MTDASELLYLAATAKADLRTGIESLRKAIASDLRSLGSSHPELSAWAETLACRYARGEEAA